MHWTATDSFKYCPQPLLHLSVSILIHISPLPCSLDLPMRTAMTASTSLFFLMHCDSFLHSQHHSIIIWSLSFLLPLSHTCAIYLFSQSQGWVAQMPRSSDLRTFACGPIKLELRRRSQLGLCQRRKLVCHQDVWVHILTEYRMNVCRVTCIIHVQSSFVFIILLFSLFFFLLFTPQPHV